MTSDSQQSPATEPQRKVYRARHGIDAVSYEPARLFPEFYRMNTDHARWDYCARELERMARDGTLYLTDVLLQPDRIRDTASDVIMGVMLINRTQQPRRPSVFLESYKVRIRSLTGENIKWERGIVPGESIGKGATTGLGIERADAPIAVHRAESEVEELESTDAMLTLREAMFCLKQAGKYVRRAKSARLQATQWKYEEVRPEASTKADEPAPKAPRKSFAEASK